MLKKLIPLVIMAIVASLAAGCGRGGEEAEFEVSSLQTTRSQAVAGEGVTVTADVSNTGEVDGSYTAGLLVNGVQVQTKNVVVAAGGTETVSFTLTEDTPGIYNVELSGLTETFEVIAMIGLVPQTANLLGQINLSDILGDANLPGLYDIVSDMIPSDIGAPQTFDELLDYVEEEFGLDLRDFEGGVLFGDLAGILEDEFLFGAIVTGAFVGEEVIGALETLAGEELSTIDYRGYTIYTDERQEMAIAVVGDGVLAIGTTDAVKDIIDVKEGDESAVGGVLLDTYNELDDVLMKVAMEVPPGLIGEALQAIPPGELPIDLGPLLAPFADMEAAALTLDKEGQSIRLDLELYFTSIDSAEDAETVINTLLTLVAMMSPGDGGGALTEKLEVSTSDSTLIISLEITMAEIVELIEGE